MGIIHTYITEKSTSAKGIEMKTRNALTKTNQQENHSHDALLDMRVDTITEGMIPYFAKKLGGKVIAPKHGVPGMGYFVLCIDTENNVFAIRETNEKAT